MRSEDTPSRTLAADDSGRHKLSEVCSVSAGPSGGLLKRLKEDADGPPVVTPPDFTVEQTIDTRNVRRVPEEDAKKLDKFGLKPGDVLLVRQGAVGRLAVVGDEVANGRWYFGSSFLRLRVDRRHLLPRFLAIYLSQPAAQEELLGAQLTGTVPSINAATLREFHIDVPPMDRQQAVTDTLADMDEAIRAQRAMAARLETLKPSVVAEILAEGRA
ncbi:restriction endonuclease subunit S [Halostreptopolyspora alba]|uniref:restriction endonuclease subunit S n=1 Tax=Halostreptopolyspora alba TaxID=2487137 RepID=UPI0026896C13